MDLHFQGPEATPAQRAAVDAVLAAGFHARRDLLLPALHG
jgi:hypothetical protein